MAAVLSEAEIQAQLGSLPGWTRKGETIQLIKTFDGFPGAIAFVNRLVDPAETAGHHPDLTISYNKVTISLTTHDAGGLTQNDFDLARQIGQL
jgi:4a-hydroxytetrahydrobiopterin dehydratase